MMPSSEDIDPELGADVSLGFGFILSCGLPSFSTNIWWLTLSSSSSWYNPSVTNRTHLRRPRVSSSSSLPLAEGLGSFSIAASTTRPLEANISSNSSFLSLICLSFRCVAAASFVLALSSSAWVCSIPMSSNRLTATVSCHLFPAKEATVAACSGSSFVFCSTIGASDSFSASVCLRLLKLAVSLCSVVPSSLYDEVVPSVVGWFCCTVTSIE
mmetsp:Transcript_17222/g.36183  ORF Transcript_17222/g.36183 Transcript_17222/m.36183 type:complete len:213 (-) Transcript_17222:3097-3735(-)